MTVREVLLDTAVFAYAAGAPHPLRGPCLAVLRALGQGAVTGHASVELVREFVFHRMRMAARDQVIRQGRDVAAVCILHDFDRAVLDRALVLMADHDGVRGRDAVHAATALHHGLDTIVSPDPAFDRVPGLRRLDPRAFSAT